MAYYVTGPKWSDKDSDETGDANSARLVYQVTADTLAEMADDDRVRNAPGIPRHDTTHPRDTSMRVSSRPVGSGLVIREVTVNYTTSPAGGTNGAGTPPASRAAKIRWGELVKSVPRDRDIDGNPILNAAGDAYSPEEQVDVYFDELFITVWRPKYDLALARQFKGKLNKKAFKSSGFPFEAETCCCRSIIPAAEFLETNKDWLEIVHRFEIGQLIEGVDKKKWSPFDTRRLNQGSRGWYKNKAGQTVRGDFYPIIGDAPIGHEVLLNENGLPFDKTLRVSKDKALPTPTPDNEKPKGVKWEIGKPPFKGVVYAHYRNVGSEDYAKLKL